VVHLILCRSREERGSGPMGGKERGEQKRRRGGENRKEREDRGGDAKKGSSFRVQS